jgi:lysozyme
MTIDRKALFDRIRIIAGRGLTQEEVNQINDILGVTDPTERRLSREGLDLIKSFEGLELKAYHDAVGVLTIGYGSTGAHVKPGMVITEAQAEELLRKDVSRFEVAVRKLCPLTTQAQYDALVSLSFNIGESALKESTLRRLHNEGKYADAAAQFARWNKAGGKEMAGLTRRRAAEAALYRRVA